MSKEIATIFLWIDEEMAQIECPYCGEGVLIGIYKEGPSYECKCGKRFLLHQRNWVTEEEE